MTYDTLQIIIIVSYCVYVSLNYVITCVNYNYDVIIYHGGPL